MKSDERFQKQPKYFWAYVRTISEAVGYTDTKTHDIKTPTFGEMKIALGRIGLDSTGIINEHEQPTDLGKTLALYFRRRAEILNAFVEPRLMDVKEARQMFNALRKQLKPTIPIPMNKQSGNKKTPAYFTAIVNMLIEANAKGFPCDFNPRKLTTVIRSNQPLRTLARRVDGAFPTTVNPIAVWEIKEYYYTTTFGSRVADGVYETLLDGMELQELREHEGIDVKHYLMVDSHYTWWVDGRSYLCRILDMLHMGYVDEVLFGHEVIDTLPMIVKDWVEIARKRKT